MKYIEMTGEYFTETLRKRLATIFQVPIANQYGCNEANSLAMECPHGQMHCLEGNALMQVYCSGQVVTGQEGDIHITSLSNYAMPFIKYAIGDRGIIHGAASCGCGNYSPILTLTHGRSGSFIEQPDGEKINSYVLTGTLEKVNEKTNSVIEQFQFEQRAPDEMIVRMVLKDTYAGWSQEVVAMFQKSLAEKLLRNMYWTFLFEDRILPDERTGKLSSFIPLAQSRCVS